MNLSYGLAAALIDVRFSVDQVSEEAIGRRDILELTRQMEIVEDSEMEGLGENYRNSTSETGHILKRRFFGLKDAKNTG